MIKANEDNSVAILDAVHWNTDGLVSVTAQDRSSGEVLMLAWMNAAALQQTLSRGELVYWSRSREKLWHKGESSGHIQKLHELRLDCDGDALLAVVEQIGGIACHTGRASCFYRTLTTDTDGKQHWTSNSDVLKDMTKVYNERL